MNIFLICSVRGASARQKKEQENYVKKLEAQGNIVYWPHRDTNQKDSSGGSKICQKTFLAILGADEVHVFYDYKSEGLRFDLGMVFAIYRLTKFSALFTECATKVVIANPKAVEKQLKREARDGIKKSYTRVLKNLAKESQKV